MGKRKARENNQSSGNSGFETFLWFAADNIRGSMDASEYKNVTKGENGHPCPVPVELMERLILLLTDDGDVV